MMKRLMALLMVLAVSGLSSAVLVDSFDGYTAGQIDTVTGGAWVSTKSKNNSVDTVPISTMVIAADPTNAANKVLSAQPGGHQSGLYGILSGSEIVANGTVKTMSLKFMVTNTAYDTSFGLTTLDAPREFGETFNTQCALVNGEFKARNGSGTSAKLAAIAANTWYYLWVVADNNINKYDIYLKTTAADATVTDRVADDFAFRTLTPDGDLDRFFVMMQGKNANTNYPNTAVLFDNINMRDGEALTYVPEPASMLLLGLGGLLSLYRRR